MKKHSFRYPAFLITSLFIIELLTACGTLQNGRGWGQDATVFPGWHRVGDAAVQAVTAPETWVPLACALVLQVDDMDKRISNYASSHTPVFGSQKAADDAGYLFRDSMRTAYIITMLAAPSGDKPGDWACSKVKGLAVGVAAIESTDLATSGLKDVSNRTRPSGSNNRSFPSSLASSTSVYASLASRNLDSLQLDGGSRIALRFGLFSVTAATGWARVEAKAHFPSDVLAGAALGHFFGFFFNDAFLGLSNPNDFIFAVEPSRDGVVVRFLWAF
jgi:hypothetical protein